jgi:hypothetical protein
MKRLWLLLTFCLLLGLFATASMASDRDISYVQVDSGDSEIVGSLVNPGFEGVYHAQDGQGPLQLANGWTARWVEGKMGVPGIGMRGTSSENTPFRRPEWKAATIDFPYRVRSGERAQQWFSYSGIHYAAIFSKALVTPGDWIYFTVYGQGWSCSQCDPLAASDVHVSLGLDTACGEDMESRSVQWSRWQWLPPAKVKTASLENWSWYKSPTVQATSSCVTVWIYTTAKWPFEHNDVYFDDVQVWKKNIGGVVATPTPYTPYPTPTPVVCPNTVDCLTRKEYEAGNVGLLTQIEAMFRRLTIELK